MTAPDERTRQIQSIERRGALGGYRLLSGLGKGGMGTVFLAVQESLDRKVAVKVLSPSMVQDKDYVRRFLEEARAVARLNHAHIVSALDAGEDRGHYYFVMEYVDGPSLARRLAREGPLSNDELRNLARQMASALAHAHQAGLIHRDVKPQNILLAPDGGAKLCDLGLAVPAHVPGRDGGNGGSNSNGNGPVTVTAAGEGVTPGGASGTPHYMAPEQARGDADLDARVDLYGLGATLYHAATGKPPFDGPTAMTVMSAHLSRPPESPRRRNPKLDPALDRLILRLLSKRREDRYPNAAALLEDLQRQGGPAPGRKKSRGRRGAARSGRPPGGGGGRFVALALVLGLVVAVAWLVWGGDVSLPGADPERQARRRLEAISTWQHTHPDQKDEALRRLDELIRDYPRTPAAELAQKLKDSLEAGR